MHTVQHTQCYTVQLLPYSTILKGKPIERIYKMKYNFMLRTTEIKYKKIHKNIIQKTRRGDRF